MRLIDSHAHLLSAAFDDDRAAVMAALSENMEAVVECASAPEDFPRIRELTQAWPFLYGAVGVHPEEISHWDAAAAETVAAALAGEKIVAVGEVGLDYHWAPETAARQKEALAAQIELARQADKPVILHNREATADLYDLLRAHRGVRGVVHCFSDGVEVARQALDLGYYIGIGGVLTFKKPGPVREAAAYAPLERILLETDCPYLAPAPHRGKRNRPDFVRYTAAVLAEIRGISAEEVIRTANANARRLFGLPMAEE